jgi:hypothetical protein
MVCPVDETQKRKPPLGANQRRLSLRHRDHQTVMTSNKHYRWEGHDEDEPERLIDR